MLKNIKSLYFIKILFVKIGERKKLSLVKYNKHLQNNLNINLVNYRLFSGKYIMFEDKKGGKEYNSCNDKLIYEGEYLNGKRNGKGKEYNDDNKLIYEGEYLNGKRNGKGKEYYLNGDILFEGEYLKGKKWIKWNIQRI